LPTHVVLHAIACRRVHADNKGVVFRELRANTHHESRPGPPSPESELESRDRPSNPPERIRSAAVREWLARIRPLTFFVTRFVFMGLLLSWGIW
jgi:hypothetical protein